MYQLVLLKKVDDDDDDDDIVLFNWDSAAPASSVLCAKCNGAGRMFHTADDRQREWPVDALKFNDLNELFKTQVLIIGTYQYHGRSVVVKLLCIHVLVTSSS